MRDIILLPTYNERENIRDIVPRIFAMCPDISVMVIDDNSPDGTAQIVEELRATYPSLMLHKRPKKEGLGLAYIDAFRRVMQMPDVRAIIMMDADLSHDPSYLPRMRELLAASDMVIGARYIRGAGTKGWGMHRKLLSKVGNWYARLITGMPIHDCTGGFNAIRVSLLRNISLDALSHFRGYAFMMALKYSLISAHARVCELPIIFKNRTKLG